MISRRQFLKLTAAAGAGAALPFRLAGANSARLLGGVQSAFAQAISDLSNPEAQFDWNGFAEKVPNALDPGFIYDTSKGSIKVAVGQTVQNTGLVGTDGVTPLPTTLWGYGDKDFYSWPGRTFQVYLNERLEVKWENRLGGLPYLITGVGAYAGRPVLDTSLHWAYSLHGYTQYNFEKDGVPIVPHLHGGHTDFQYDGNPEFFFSPGYTIRGPQWRDKKYVYKNDQPAGAGTLWYHDHALGITRLNVYAGMAGFYIVRDKFDTGGMGPQDDDLGLPKWPYEVALAIQDRMFKQNGELFYPAFPGDPSYADFITGEGAVLPELDFPGGGPTGLAEFFGDHMVVNGKIWPKMDVEPVNYRLRLLNGCDSRFLAIQFFEVPEGQKHFGGHLGQLPFTVIGSDQGLASSPTPNQMTLLMETGSRYDIILDFSQVTVGNRVIMKNIGGDEPFGGEIGEAEPFTDRIMAFDVTDVTGEPSRSAPPGWADYGTPIPALTRETPRKVALFEGKDEFGRLQPLLGTAEPATDYDDQPIFWPDDPVYSSVGLMATDQMEGSIAWHSPTTENPALGSTEEWEIWNMTGDAHPVHLHLVHFEILGREEIVWDDHTIGGEDEDRVIPNALHNSAAGDGTYLVTQPTVQHNSVAGDETTYGMGFKIMTPTKGGDAGTPAEYVENAPKDMVTALPGQVTRIKATFDKPGRYVWHCHILSHEDHEMMRVLHVGEGA